MLLERAERGSDNTMLRMPIVAVCSKTKPAIAWMHPYLAQLTFTAHKSLLVCSALCEDSRTMHVGSKACPSACDP